MFKIECAKNLFVCEECDQLLVDPVTLPCGDSVCKKHLDALLESSPKDSNTFLCKLCDDEHYIPKKGFAINKRIQNNLNRKLSSLKLNPVYEKCKKEINDVKNNLQKVEAFERDSENVIFEYFEELKRCVDLRREGLKLELDNCSDGIMQSIESAKDNCVKLSKESPRLGTESEESNKKLAELIDRFDIFEFNDRKFDEIMQSLTVLNRDLIRILSQNKYSILGGKDYTFEFQEIDITGLFGCFKEVEKTLESTIMGACLQNQLVKLCEFPQGQKWDLKYRASRDGFKASDFHKKCDGIGNTLTVIQAKSGNIFGGFAEKEWHSSSGFVEDPKAFIISLINKEENQFKAMCSDLALICNPDYGPSFGKDMMILSDSNLKRGSFAELGNWYQHPDYLEGTDIANNILAGSHFFETVEIEVFAKTN